MFLAFGGSLKGDRTALLGLSECSEEIRSSKALEQQLAHQQTGLTPLLLAVGKIGPDQNQTFFLMPSQETSMNKFSLSGLSALQLQLVQCGPPAVVH